MPFGDGALITVENPSQEAIDDLCFCIDCEEHDGMVVGLNYYVDNPGRMWYGEGDDMWMIVCLTLDIATVAYWYRLEPHKPFGALPGIAERQNMPAINLHDIHYRRQEYRKAFGGDTRLWGHEWRALKREPRTE